MKYLHKFTDHLEFLGYKTELIPEEQSDDVDMALARHTQDNNIMLIASKNSPLLFMQVRYNFKKRISTIMYEYLDEANGRMNLSRAYLSEDDSQLIVETHWTGEYDKKLFGEFITSFSNDRQILVSLPDFNKIWVE